jgi:hypothetical protein
MQIHNFSNQMAGTYITIMLSKTNAILVLIIHSNIVWDCWNSIFHLMKIFLPFHWQTLIINTHKELGGVRFKYEYTTGRSCKFLNLQLQQ